MSHCMTNVVPHLIVLPRWPLAQVNAASTDASTPVLEAAGTWPPMFTQLYTITFTVSKEEKDDALEIKAVSSSSALSKQP